MSKTLTFSVSITFEDKITSDLEVMEVAENIARGIISEANEGMGIAPEDSETFTRNVEVTPQFINKTITKEFI